MTKEKAETIRNIPLGKNKTLRSNNYCWWIARERHYKDKSGEQKVSYDRLSGYHVDVCGLLDSYIDREIKIAEIESLTELVDEVKKLRREIRKWVREGNLKEVK